VWGFGSIRGVELGAGGIGVGEWFRGIVGIMGEVGVGGVMGSRKT
jgi:hypothetical protein